MNEGNTTKPRNAVLNLSRRHFVMGGLFATASAVAYAREPRIVNPIIDAETFEEWVPGRFGEWRVQSESGVVLPPPDTTRDRLYDNLVTRVYVANGWDPVMLLLAYNNAQDGVLQVHRPETCYPVGGFLLSDTVKVDLPVGQRKIPSNLFTASGPDRIEQVMYFTRLGDDFPRSWVEQRISVVEANLRAQIPDGMMMRISMIGSDRERAMETLSSFAEAFILSVPAKLRRLLIG